MNYRPLGTIGVKVSELGLGCSSIGNSVFNRGEDKFFLDILNYAFDNGINFYDTANTYAYGNSEILIGKAFKGKRDKVIISTKVGFLPSSLSNPAKNFIPFLGRARKLIAPFKKSLKKISKKRQNFSADHIKESIDKSLTRLNTDYIDIYLLHNPHAEIINDGEIFNILDKLKADGKIRFYGVSAGSIDDAILCLNYPDVSVLQIEFNLIAQEAALKLFPLLEINEVGIIAKMPLARGLLTNKGKVQTGHFPSKNLHEQNLEKIIGNMNKDVFPEAAFRFILEQKHVSTLIAGTKSISHLKENIKIIENPSLTDAELKKIYSL